MIWVIHLSFCGCENLDWFLVVGFDQQTQFVSLFFFFFRVRPLSDGSNPWSTSLVKSQKSVPLAALFAEQGELKMQPDAACLNYPKSLWYLLDI